MFGFNWNKKKVEQWIFMAAVGALLLVLTLPEERKEETISEGQKEPEAAMAASAKTEISYEETLERRIRELLQNVEGVGKVDVMVSLRASEQRVYHVDQNSQTSSTIEKDREGGTRELFDEEISETTILADGGQGNAPVLERELKPEIEGIIISAQGGGSSKIQSEISQAMEALLGIPSHKIKVLKRAE